MIHSPMNRLGNLLLTKINCLAKHRYFASSFFFLTDNSAEASMGELDKYKTSFNLQKYTWHFF